MVPTDGHWPWEESGSADTCTQKHEGDDLPATCISYDAAHLFLKKLKSIDIVSDLPGEGTFRLPHAVEWAAALALAAGGRINGRADEDDIDVHLLAPPPGSGIPEDLLGNVAEWQEEFQPGSTDRYTRGGSLGDVADAAAMAAAKPKAHPSDRELPTVGFRVAWED